MPGLIRGVARTAVIAGTATHVSNNVSRRQQGRWAAKQQQEQPQEQQYAPPPPPPAAPAGTDMESKLAQLKELGELKEAGVLNELEFEQQKNRILNS
jgi:hypothetical protein